MFEASLQRAPARHLRILWLALLLPLGGATVAAQDTFSIVAVDPLSQQVGSAGASCIAGAIIISDVHPGVGAIHTQSFYNAQNQAYARDLMDAGKSPEEIIDLLVANDAQGNPAVRQYGIVDLVDGGRSAGFTGAGCLDYKNHVLAPTYAIAGNILLGQQVLDGMETGFLTTAGSLADKLMAALQGANIPGADSRCLDDGKPAISAFIRVALIGDVAPYYLDLNVNNTNPSQNPIDLLQVLYDDWRATVGVEAAAPAPALRLAVAQPNPSRSTSTIAFELAAPAATTLRVYDVGGRLVRTLLDARLAAGGHRRVWNGRDGHGLRSPAGIYVYRLEALNQRLTRKLVLID